MLSLVFMLLYLPGSVICSNWFNKYGLRKSFLASSLIQVIGCGFRYLSTIGFIHNNGKGIESYIVLLIGQTLCGLIQPCFTNSPARISNEWFSKDTRDVVTAILSIVNPFGVGLGSVIPTIFVKPNDKNNEYKGFVGLLFLQFILSIIGLFLIILFFYDKPPTPPSLSQKIKNSSRFLTKSHDAIGGGGGGANGTTTTFNQQQQQQQESQFVKDLKIVLNDRKFFKLAIGFGIGLGLFNCVTTLINQWTEAFYYSSDDAGLFGGLLMAGGLMGAVITGIIMDCTHAYKIILRTATFLTTIMFFILIINMKKDNHQILYILFAIFGFVAIPIVAVTFEYGVECTFPISEEVSSGVLMVSGSIIGIAYLLIWGGLLPTTGHHYDTVWNVSTYFLLGNILLCTLFMFMFDGDYKRLKAEHALQNFVDDVHYDNDSSINYDENNNNNNNNDNNDDKEKQQFIQKKKQLQKQEREKEKGQEQQQQEKRHQKTSINNDAFYVIPQKKVLITNDDNYSHSKNKTNDYSCEGAAVSDDVHINV